MNLYNLNTIAFQRTTTAKSRNTSLVLELLNITLLLCCQYQLVQDEKWCRMPLPSFVPLSRENSDISAIGLLSPYPLSYSPSFSSHFPSLVMFVGPPVIKLQFWKYCDITDGRIPQPWREMKTKKPKGNEESKASKVTRPKAQDVKFSSLSAFQGIKVTLTRLFKERTFSLLLRIFH